MTFGSVSGSGRAAISARRSFAAMSRGRIVGAFEVETTANGMGEPKPSDRAVEGEPIIARPLPLRTVSPIAIVCNPRTLVAGSPIGGTN